MARTTAADGTEVDYSVSGVEDGPPMVFVHGWCCDRRYFEPQVRHFGRTHRVVALDLRGHGASGPSASYSVEDFVADVQAAVVAEGLGQPIVVGHSMGGVVALAAATSGLAGSAVLVDPAPLVGKIKERFREGGASYFGAGHDGDVRSALAGLIEFMFLPTDDAATRRWVSEAMLSTPVEVVTGAWEGLVTFDGEAALRACTAPVLVIEAATPNNRRSELIELLPSITVGQTVGAGHFNQLLVPDQVNSMIERFIAVS